MVAGSAHELQAQVVKLRHTRTDGAPPEELGLRAPRIQTFVLFAFRDRHAVGGMLNVWSF